MPNGNHDTLVYRLAQTLIKLNQGERLSPQSLAEEYGVNLRTIQRDLNVRFAYLPLEKIDGLYHLEPIFLGKLSSKDIERFASLAGVRGLFPSLSENFLREIFDNSTQSLLVKGHSFESLDGKAHEFELLDKAIASHKQISFDYEKTTGIKTYPIISPYKMLNNHGIWYLVAVDGVKLKTFSFSKIQNIRVLSNKFKYSQEIESEITREDGIWFNKDKIKVILNIDKAVAHYFKRRKLIANQRIEEELENGSLILSSMVGHENQIIPIIRYWIPHIRVISPADLQEKLERELRDYIGLLD